MMRPYLPDNQMSSQFEYDHQAYPLILARSPAQNDDGRHYIKQDNSMTSIKGKTYSTRYDHLK